MIKLIGIFLFLLFLSVFFSVIFFWFQVRPSWIKSDCDSQAKIQAVSLTKIQAEMYPNDYSLQESASRGLFYTGQYESYYSRCLREKGL